MRNTLILAILLSGLLLGGCDKDQSRPISGVTAMIDGQATQFVHFGVGYTKGENLISISATTTNNEVITFRAYLPDPGPLGTSFFRANGTNTIAIVKYGKTQSNNPPPLIPENCSFSDENKSDLEGQLTITKLDEVGHKASGTFSFKTYNRKLNQYRTVTEGLFTDMHLLVSNVPPRTNSMTCTASPSNEWLSNVVVAFKNHLFGEPVLRIEANGFQTPVDDFRNLNFHIPMSSGTGTFDVKPDTTFQNWKYHLAEYNYYFEDYKYQPVPNAGTITVHSIDDVNNTVSFSFNLQMVNKDGSTVSFSNGQVEAKWLE